MQANSKWGEGSQYYTVNNNGYVNRGKKPGAEDGKGRRHGHASVPVSDISADPLDRDRMSGVFVSGSSGTSLEKPPSPGLVYSYVIDSDDHRRAEVHRAISGRSDMVARTFRDRDAFLAEADGLDQGCVIFFDSDAAQGAQMAPFIRGLRRSQRFACILLATRRDIRVAIEAMKAGAADCLLYPCEAEEIMVSVDEALAQVRESSRRNAALVEARQQIDRLTAREQDVLLGLMHGKSNKMIALDLAISPRTVEIYRAHLMEKLGTHSLSETLKVAFAAGLA